MTGTTNEGIGGGYDPATYDPHQHRPPPPHRHGILQIARAQGQDARDEAWAAGASDKEIANAYSNAYNKAHPWIQARHNHRRQNARWRKANPDKIPPPPERPPPPRPRARPAELSGGKR